jgi:hypothetical protein
MSLLNVDAINESTAATGVTVEGVLVKDSLLKIPGGSPGADKVLTSDASGNATWEDAAAGGKVLQVQHTSLTVATFSTSTTTAVDITGMTVDIQPSATTSKILLMSTVNFNMSDTNVFCGFTALRDSTAIDNGIGTGVGSRIACAAWGSDFNNQTMSNVQMTFLDEPSSTSTITYKLQVDIDGGVFYLNRSTTDSDNTSFGRTISTLTAMEIGA